ncbi:hypothetical protein C2S53_007799 [Perilla frutescens var. hirtella]|uniref:RING-type domain-containing protein n=1 Tax=Perilla frutescens var. hirtella TaxID=608512 RepID=A0AAD4IW34_PERFH|nr:hypothetical protein C2S53_007799 [Perilla frutescens var. hirtella]
MGLQNQLSDASSESVIVLMAMLIGKSVSYLNSLILTILHHLGLLAPPFDAEHDRHFVNALNDVVGSGLASLIVLCDQLSINRGCSYPNRSDDLDMDCVVCLNRLARGDHVRRLACRHVFHKDCLDGWLQHLNFNCPLCRSPLPSDDQVDCTQRRVAGDLLAWFPTQ